MLSQGAWDQRQAYLLLGIVCVGAMLALVFQSTFTFLYAAWHREEYSHGILIPPLTGFLLWQRRALFQRTGLKGSWWGVSLIVFGLLVFFTRFFAFIVGLDAYALVIVVAGLALAAFGWQGFRLALVPIALLLLMYPLPTFWYNNLSSELQLLSSQLGVAFMRAFGVSVFLQGNVIDLGTYQLEVAEACSGLRYLFPLMTLGAVVAYLFKGKLWMRWCLFLSTLPITVLMNSLRIGIIGILVDRFGSAQAEGFLHQFEGWLIFMACLAVLLAEIKLLLVLSRDGRSLRDVVAVSAPVPGWSLRANPSRKVGKPVLAGTALLALAVYPAFALPQHAEVRPARIDFSQFPMQIGEWRGQRGRVEDVYLDQLKLDDYLLADFVPNDPSPKTPASHLPVNLYVAYYASQRSYQGVHSPRSCLPGAGWRIEQLEQRSVPGVLIHGAPLRVNRVLIQLGAQRQLVYYWFQERGRDLTNEVSVKWYLFEDAIERDRTDGALVRVITPLSDGENAATADARLVQFTAAALPLLGPYVPD